MNTLYPITHNGVDYFVVCIILSWDYVSYHIFNDDGNELYAEAFRFLSNTKSNANVVFHNWLIRKEEK